MKNLGFMFWLNVLCAVMIPPRVYVLYQTEGLSSWVCMGVVLAVWSAYDAIIIYKES